MNKLFQQILDNRGLSEAFLHPKYEDLTPPELLPDMEKAVKRLQQAKKQGDKILVYGDYDVDGVTATAIIVETLKLMGITGVETMLPDRFIDGYGMSKRLVERAQKTGVNLVLTVDCGSNNAEIVDELVANDIEVIVTDHHEISHDIPERAVAVINPKRPDFKINYQKATKPPAKPSEKTQQRPPEQTLESLQNLCGAGVAFMLACALKNAREIPDGQEKWLLDLAMIGTICDSMVLTRDNRIICHFGKIVLEKTRRPGLKELLKASGITKINTDAIGFGLGPRLNASGRLETAERSLSLLLTTSCLEAVKIAEELNNLNQERKKQQSQALSSLEQTGVGSDPVIVVKGKWGEGVIGIIAGRLTEKYHQPSFVFTEVSDVLKGSGRSFGDFNLALALRECQDLLIGGGGHAAACGLSLKPSDFQKFKGKINHYYQGLNLKNQERYFGVIEDAIASDFSDFNVELLDNLSLLEPFGEGNPAPVFLLKDALVLRADKMGAESQHLRLLLRDDNGHTVKLVAFNAPEDLLNLRENARINAWISVMENEWQGIRSVEGRILKAKPA